MAISESRDDLNSKKVVVFVVALVVFSVFFFALDYWAQSSQGLALFPSAEH